jgi:hypothetical protein
MTDAVFRPLFCPRCEGVVRPHPEPDTPEITCPWWAGGCGASWDYFGRPIGSRWWPYDLRSAQ